MSSSSPSLSSRQHEELSLSQAMKAADSIRRNFKEAVEQSSGPSEVFAPSVPPGISHALGGFLVMGAVLLPVRRLVLAHPSVNSHQNFRNFVDLVASVGHALVATQTALIAGSIYGGKRYLDEFAKENSTLTDQPSSSLLLVDVICQDLKSSVVPPGTILPVGLDPESFDPRVQTMLSMIRVIEICQSRGS